MSHQSCGGTPTSSMLKLRLVFFRNLIKFAIKQIAFGYCLAAGTKTVRRYRHRQVFTFVTCQQETNIQFVVKTITPLLIKLFSQELAFPEHSWLRCIVGPGKG